MAFSLRFLTLLVSAIAVAAPASAFPTEEPSRTIRRHERQGQSESGLFERRASLSSYTLPTHGGGTELPAPTPGLTLKAVTLGRGTQNYTCANGVAAPTQVGALATLYDLSMVPEWLFNTLTNLAVNVPLADMAPLSLDAIGHHYFDSTGAPNFDLGSIGHLIAAKQADIPAPAGAAAGPSGSGAVDWLELGDKGTSTGLKEVYRVETAGGKAPTSCTGQPTDIYVQYAAQYFFYG
ncbi:MAG: hypothetical protein M1838_002193 [Thelocarpon superellum]|nr:MAG: hypothetical protein M1838_002193 [Thelocarpon superellum]